MLTSYLKLVLINYMPRLILNSCFEPILAHLTTPSRNDWTNFLLLLIPYQMQKLTLLEIKLTHNSSLLWACISMSDHTHLKQPTNICCIHEPLVTSKNSTSYLILILWSSSLKNPAFWLALRFLGHNSRPKFFSSLLILEKVKRPLPLPWWIKKTYISEWIRFLLKP